MSGAVCAYDGHRACRRPIYRDPCLGALGALSRLASVRATSGLLGSSGRRRRPWGAGGGSAAPTGVPAASMTDGHLCNCVFRRKSDPRIGKASFRRDTPQAMSQENVEIVRERTTASQRPVNRSGSCSILRSKSLITTSPTQAIPTEALRESGSGWPTSPRAGIATRWSLNGSTMPATGWSRCFVSTQLEREAGWPSSGGTGCCGPSQRKARSDSTTSTIRTRPSKPPGFGVGDVAGERGDSA